MVAVVKNIAALKSIGDMTIFTNPLTKNTFRMRILMASDAASDFNRTKFPLSQVAFVTGDPFMFAGQRKLSFLTMIKVHPWVNGLPPDRAVTALAIE